MPYNDFTLDSIEEDLDITIRRDNLFPNLQAVPEPLWLTESLERGRGLALMSEKARSEYIVAPVLLAVRELSQDSISILSGQRLDVDPERRLHGECDFILALDDPLPRLRAPLVTIVEAKRHDIDVGLPQCIAQMVAARIFNERASREVPSIYGCVTTGEDWQFLRLRQTDVRIDRARYYINDLDSILGAFISIFQEAAAPAQS